MLLLRLLGGLSLSGNSSALTGPATQRHRLALLALLARSRSRPQSRDKLVAWLWPERDVEHARNLLNQSVHALRRTIGEAAIVSNNDELRLDAAAVACDVVAFEEAIAAGELERAIGLYTGPFLDGFHLPGASEFEHWADEERERLRRSYARGLQSLAEAAEARNEWSGAVDWWRILATEEPCNAHVTLQLMRALDAAGNRAGALQQARVHTLLLEHEFEAGPDPEVVELAERLRKEPPRRSPSTARPDVLEPLTETQVLGSRIHPEPVESPKFVSPPLRAFRHKALVAAAVIVTLLLALARIQLRTQSRDHSIATLAAPSGEPAPAIAVLPFVHEDQARTKWHEGLMDLVSMDLNGVPGLRAVDSRTVLARWREEVVGGEAPSLSTSLDVAGRAGGRYAVAGSVIADGPDLLLTAGVHEVAGHRMLGTARSRGPADSIFTLVDRLTLEILRLIPGGDARELSRVDLARVNTASLPALKAFLEGEVLFRRSQFESAAEAYGRAVEADSTFALARYRLGVSRQWFWNDVIGSVPDPLAPAVGRFAGGLPQHEAAMFRAYQLSDLDVRAERDLLDEESRRHPEDADTWYELGEFYHHSGAELAIPPGGVDWAMSRAIALDSTFSLPYIHLIEYAISQRDTARVERLLRTFGRLAPGTRHVAQLRLLAGLVVGDSIARSTSEAALQTLDIYRLFWLGFQLVRTRSWDLSERAFRMASERGEHRADATLPLFFTILAQGKAGAAHRWVGDPVTPQARKARMLDALVAVGAPVPAAELDAILSLGATDSTDAIQVFYLGSLAASRGKWQVAQSSLEQLRSRVRSLGTSGDSSQIYFTEAMRQGLEGYVLWREGQRDRALPLLQQSQPHALGGRGVGDRLRWWVGGLLLEMGRPREALPYFESLTGNWLPADYERGRLYEQLGMANQAQEAYARFLAPRQRADPVFQPMIRDARRALERLAQGVPESERTEATPVTASTHPHH